MRLACVQADVVFGDPAANLRRATKEVRAAKDKGADLVVFPEAFLSGYCVSSHQEALGIAIAGNAPELIELNRLAAELDVLIVTGFAENEEGILHNTAALFEPGRRVRIYRKTHLPFLGYDWFAKPGHELPVFDTRLGKIGIMICFDQRLPEVARTLTLKGASLILVPTNWPEGAETSADHISIARAAENRVFLAAVNRVGSENGFRFIGRSKIVSPTGSILASAGDEEVVIEAEIDLNEARMKRTVNIPGIYETEMFAIRQPDLYRPVVDLIEPVE